MQDSYLNPDAKSWSAPVPLPSTLQFHRAVPGYEPTPLKELPELAAELGVGRVFVKEEAERIGLPAFKILGASWAIAKAVSAVIGVDVRSATIESLRAALADGPDLVLVTATDGNHGRAVSHMARLLGIRARVYMPAKIAQTAKEPIRDEGAELIEVEAVYDDVVRIAAASATGHENELIIQDTSWEGYTDVPRWIVEGYGTLFSEVDQQLHEAGASGASLVAVGVGVGSLIQAAIEFYRGVSGTRPAILSVEPVTAPCVLDSLRAGEIVTVDTSFPSIMAGLNCGTPSDIAWPALKGGLDAAVLVSDDDSRASMQELARLGVSSGPCGASTLAGVRALLASSRQELGLGETSVIVLISTDGRPEVAV